MSPPMQYWKMYAATAYLKPLKKFVHIPIAVRKIHGLFLKRLANCLKENFSALTCFTRSRVSSPQASVITAARMPKPAPSTAYWCASVPPTIFCR